MSAFLSKAFGTRFYYGWVVVMVTALTLIVSAGVRSAPGVMLLPMEQDLHWNRTLISFAASLGLLMYGLSAPISGWLMNRFSIRFVMLMGLILSGISMIISAQMTQIWQLNLFWGIMSGIGTGIGAIVLGATVANRWFMEKRGLVVGIFGAATSAGQLIFYPLLVQLLILLGWRNTINVLAGMVFLILIPVFLLMRDHPSDLGLQPLGAEKLSSHAGEKSPKELKSSLPTAGILWYALSTTAFWLLASTFFICGATSNGLIGTHFIPHLGDHGVPQTTAASMLALMGTMNFVGTICSGWLTDRYNPRKLLACYYALRGLSLLFLPFVTSHLGLIFFSILFGLDYIATVPPTTMLVADTFGRQNVGMIFGWIFLSHQIGAALAAWLGGYAYDQLGSYAPAFLSAGLLAVIAAMLALWIQKENEANPIPKKKSLTEIG